MQLRFHDPYLHSYEELFLFLFFCKTKILFFPEVGNLEKNAAVPKIDTPAKLKLKATKLKEESETPLERLKRLENGEAFNLTDEQFFSLNWIHI